MLGKSGKMRGKWSKLALLISAYAALGASAVPGADPLSVTPEIDDAERFAALFERSNAAPSAEALQAEYLDQGGRALEIFTPNRIVDAQRLADAVARDPSLYRDAIERCLPMVETTRSDLRAIYLGFRGLFPEKPLPRIAVVFGAGNSGGTAEADMQVLGLEVLCSLAPDAGAFRSLMRQFYAHETVHTFQRFGGPKVDSDPMLTAAINEGTADYVAALVTGQVPDPERDRWAREREDFVLNEFARDLATVRNREMSSEARNAAYFRWFANAGIAPEGRPSELGYWVGMKIAEGYVQNASDPHAALHELLVFDDPALILERSGINLSLD